VNSCMQTCKSYKMSNKPYKVELHQKLRNKKSKWFQIWSSMCFALHLVLVFLKLTALSGTHHQISHHQLSLIVSTIVTWQCSCAWYFSWNEVPGLLQNQLKNATEEQHTYLCTNFQGASFSILHLIWVGWHHL